ncbi:VOC family protein [Rhizomonospora bruguierae]|uniref:VOC family protein n=1 Tax=Rhizomonospora bruguierae TaxID=1581705 RepID=UPI0020C15696|nr:VOC family protein [Micromonospora sp. NBRC 107566]
MSPTAGALHHVEVWVPDLAGARHSWGWLLAELGWQPFQDWANGCSWRQGETYIVVEQSPALAGRVHERLAPGVNHLAFHAGPPARVDALVAVAPGYGWSLMFEDRHPYAGGPGVYAAYLEDAYGYEVELVAEGLPEPS